MTSATLYGERNLQQAEVVLSKVAAPSVYSSQLISCDIDQRMQECRAVVEHERKKNKGSSAVLDTMEQRQLAYSLLRTISDGLEARTLGLTSLHEHSTLKLGSSSLADSLNELALKLPDREKKLLQAQVMPLKMECWQAELGHWTSNFSEFLDVAHVTDSSAVMVARQKDSRGLKLLDGTPLADTALGDSRAVLLIPNLKPDVAQLMVSQPPIKGSRQIYNSTLFGGKDWTSQSHVAVPFMINDRILDHVSPATLYAMLTQKRTELNTNNIMLRSIPHGSVFYHDPKSSRAHDYLTHEARDPRSKVGGPAIPQNDPRTGKTPTSHHPHVMLLDMVNVTEASSNVAHVRVDHNTEDVLRFNCMNLITDPSRANIGANEVDTVQMYVIHEMYNHSIRRTQPTEDADIGRNLNRCLPELFPAPDNVRNHVENLFYAAKNHLNGTVFNDSQWSPGVVSKMPVHRNTDILSQIRTPHNPVRHYFLASLIYTYVIAKRLLSAIETRPSNRRDLEPKVVFHPYQQTTWHLANESMLNTFVTQREGLLNELDPAFQLPDGLDADLPITDETRAVFLQKADTRTPTATQSDVRSQGRQIGLEGRVFGFGGGGASRSVSETTHDYMDSAM
ncbi:MAG: uncharacterized protein KVP18_001698 [Porospora cf. gigantea A]|nr:MAG: hypothetical protein KVP18_001698 [Porospora cf. gigantea A]